MTEKYLLLAAYFGGLLLYGLLNTRKNAPYDLRTALDRYIPLVPAFVVAYFGIFLFLPVAVVFLFETPLAIEFLIALVIGMYLAAIFWYLFPARMYRPEITGHGVFDRIVALLYHDDPHTNGFPSSHVINSVIASFYLSIAFPQYWIYICIVGVAIALSTVFIKQHRALDVVGGVVWAAVSIALARYFVG